MAKFDLKFIAKDDNERTIEVFSQCNSEIVIVQRSENGMFTIVLDKSTAIKFAKTLRTEINKIQEGGSNE